MLFHTVHLGLSHNEVGTRDSLIKSMMVISQHVTSAMPETGLQILYMVNLDMGPPEQLDRIDSSITAITPYLASLL